MKSQNIVKKKQKNWELGLLLPQEKIKNWMYLTGMDSIFVVSAILSIRIIQLIFKKKAKSMPIIGVDYTI